MSKILFGMVLGATLLYVGMHYHVVRGDAGVFLVPKLEKNLSGIYTDVREYTLQDWQANRSLAVAIMQSNRSELIQDTTRGGIAETMHTVVDHLLAH